MIMVINMANTVEYNEYRTGKRDEGLIFSLRPFTAKMGSALMQGLVSLVYVIAGVLTYTNKLTDIDRGLGGEATYETVIAQVPNDSKIKLLVFTCVIPMVFLAVALIVYKKKCFLNEAKMAEMMAVIEERKLAAAQDEDGTRVATAASKSSVGLTSHTSPFCNDYNKLQSFAFWSLCSFSHTPKTVLSSFLLTPKFTCF